MSPTGPRNAQNLNLGLLALLLGRLRAQLSPRQIWLFGSRARGDARIDSDWDLLVVVPDDTPDVLLDLLFLWHLQRGSGVRADLIACRESEFRAAADTVNTLAYAAMTEGICIEGS